MAMTAEHAGVLTFIETRHDAADHAKTVLRNYVAVLRQDTSSQPRVELLQEIARPERFVLIESAGTQRPAGAQATVPPTLEALTELLTAPPDRRSHRGFGDVSTPAAQGADVVGRATLYVVTHVDIGPPDLPRGEAALLRIATEARRSAGNLRFDVWRQTDRANHFNIIAVWRGRESFDAFAASQAAREFRQSAGSMLGSLYDERLYARAD